MGTSSAPPGREEPPEGFPAPEAGGMFAQMSSPPQGAAALEHQRGGGAQGDLGCSQEGMWGHGNGVWKGHGMYRRHLETWEETWGHREGALKGHGRGGWLGMVGMWATGEGMWQDRGRQDSGTVC